VADPRCLGALIAATIAVASCGGGDAAVLPEVPSSATRVTMSNPQFTTGSFVRQCYTCDGLNLSPQVSW